MAEIILIERAAELVQTDIDSEMVAVDLRQGTCFGFNSTAAAVWRMLDQPRPIAEIARLLSDEFTIDFIEAEAAVNRLVTDLLTRNLVRTRVQNALP